MDKVDESSAAPAVGGPFGKYRLLQQLALGGMAHIFLATLDGPDGFSKPCVIKRILPEYASLESFSRMFAAEAKIAALLTHPNIVQVFDFGKIDGQYYLAMEWIQGASLDRVLRHAHEGQGPFTLGPRLAVDVGIAVASALAYAHEKTLPDGTPLNLVHRDITPGNVLVSRDGNLKLADFGIVKTSVNLEQTVAGVVKGKYAYMSPEQITNQAMDHRSDLFSLGIVLYETSTGRRLFKRDTMEATILAASYAEIPPPSSFDPGFPPGLEQILLRLLSKDPNARHQSAHELREDLERFRSSQQWTSGGRELAGLMASLFPADRSKATLTAIPAVGSVSATAASRVSSPTAQVAPPPPPRVQEDYFPAVDVEEVVPAPRSVAGEFPWGIAGAVGAAVLGSALFWYLVG